MREPAVASSLDPRRAEDRRSLRAEAKGAQAIALASSQKSRGAPRPRRKGRGGGGSGATRKAARRSLCPGCVGRRRCEAGEFALDEAGESERRPVFEFRANDLDANGQTFRNPDWNDSGRQSARRREFGPRQLMEIGKFLAVDCDLSRVLIRRMIVRKRRRRGRRTDDDV